MLAYYKTDDGRFGTILSKTKFAFSLKEGVESSLSNDILIDKIYYLPGVNKTVLYHISPQDNVKPRIELRNYDGLTDEGSYYITTQKDSLARKCMCDFLDCIFKYLR